MKLVVGLGNPGPRYADTRHNVGVRVLEHFARRQGIPFPEQGFEPRFRSRLGLGHAEGGEAGGVPVALLAPQTFMNRSGPAVAEALVGLEVASPAEDLLLVFDDVDLPFGRLRLRPGGGAGGHRGVESVIEALARRDFPRLRFGVGRPGEDLGTVEHVLEPFSASERRQLPDHVKRASRAIAAVLHDGVAEAMNEFNRDPEAASIAADRPPSGPRE